MPSFTILNSTLEDTAGKPFAVVFTLALVDQTKYKTVLTNLTNSKVVESDMGYAEFSVEATQLQGQQPAIKIAFNLLESHIIFPEVVKLLRVNGVGFEASEIYLIKKSTFLADGERFYLNAALNFIKKMKVDDINSIFYIEIQRLIRELPIEFRLSFVCKVSEIFNACNMPNCALNTIILYSNHSECKTIIEGLQSNPPAVSERATQQPIKFDSNIIAKIVSRQAFTAKHQLLNFTPTAYGSFKALIFGLPDQVANATLYDLLRANNTLKVKDNTYCFQVSEFYVDGMSNKKIHVSFASEIQYKILDHILVQLAKAGYYFHESDLALLRIGFGFASIENLVQFFPVLIDQLTDDNPNLFMYKWLESLCFQIGEQYRTVIIMQIANELKQQGLVRCSTSLLANLEDIVVYQVAEILKYAPMLSSLAIHAQRATQQDDTDAQQPDRKLGDSPKPM